MPVEFRVLGPLEIRRDGSPVRLRASKQRTFLAVLLVNHGRVVSVDRLIEDVWPEGAPAGARHALETHASRLRNALGDDLRLVARPPGYVLEIDAGSLDSVRFEQLLAEARSSEPARAAARAADALALWRGSALADFTFESFAAEEIGRLEELRLEAEEERVEAELALGRAAELVGELEALVAAAPLRERRRAQLMLALYRSGRQAEALAAFRDARRLLVEELGLEPGDALRGLEQAILRQDPALAADAATRPARPAARRRLSVVAVEPRLAPDLDPEEHERLRRSASEAVARTADAYAADRPEPFLLAFAQEDHELRAARAAVEIHRTLDADVGVETGDAIVRDGEIAGPLVDRARRRAREDGAPPEPPAAPERRLDGPFVGRRDELERLRTAAAALVVGPPGIGKSRLAHELGRGGPVVVGRCSSYGAAPLAPLHEIAAALGSPGALEGVHAPEVPLTFRSLCEDAPALVVFDDVHWADPIVLETIDHLVGRSGGAVRVLCLARDELLEERPSFLAGALRIELQPLSESDARELAVQLGAGDESIVARAEGNPLFIEQLLAHAGEGDAGLPTTLQSLLAARLDRLTAGERATIDGAAVVGREFAGSLVTELVDAPGAREWLAALVRRGLVEPAPPSEAFEERYRFRHPLIHETAYASTTAADRARMHETAADLLDARGAGHEVVGFHLEQASALRPERDRHALRLAEDAGRRLGEAGIAAFKLGYVRHTAGLLERATALLPDGDAQRRELLCELGLALTGSGDGERGLETYLRAIAAAEEAGDRRVLRRGQIETGALEVARGVRPTSEVLALADDAISLFASVGDDRSLGRTALIAGWIKGGALADHRAWELEAERSLAHYRRAGWPTSVSSGHVAAALYHGPSPAGTAIARCETLLAGEVDELAAEANVSVYLAGLHAMTGESERAAELFARARALLLDLGRAPALATTCAPVEAAAARLAGDTRRAIALLEESCAALVASGQDYYVGTQGAELAELLAAEGRADDAERWLETAERSARADDRISQIWLAIARARLHAAGGRGDDAVAAANDAVAIGSSTDALNHRALALLTLADVLPPGNERSTHVAGAVALYTEKENTAAVLALTAREPAAESSRSPS